MIKHLYIAGMLDTKEAHYILTRALQKYNLRNLSVTMAIWEAQFTLLMALVSIFQKAPFKAIMQGAVEVSLLYSKLS